MDRTERASLQLRDEASTLRAKGEMLRIERDSAAARVRRLEEEGREKETARETEKEDMVRSRQPLHGRLLTLGGEVLCSKPLREKSRLSMFKSSPATIRCQPPPRVHPQKMRRHTITQVLLSNGVKLLRQDTYRKAVKKMAKEREGLKTKAKEAEEQRKATMYANDALFFQALCIHGDCCSMDV